MALNAVKKSDSTYTISIEITNEQTGKKSHNFNAKRVSSDLADRVEEFIDELMDELWF